MIRGFFRVIFSLLLSLSLCVMPLLSFSSCTDNGNGDEKISVVVTVFPVYDWVYNILGDNPSDVSLSLIMDSGKDVHSYQATVDDIVRVSSADLVIYVGGESDKWVLDAVKNSGRDDIRTVRLLDYADACDGDSCDSDDEHFHNDKDEHVWLSLKLASVICEAIAGELMAIDNDGAYEYQRASFEYLSVIADLDREYAELIDGASHRSLVFADRFPFKYMFEDYGLGYYAAFDGCSSDSEASFETVIDLASKVDELGLSYVFIIDGADGKLANTVISNTASADQSILILESMQSVSKGEVQSGISYISVMKSNLEALRLALA